MKTCSKCERKRRLSSFSMKNGGRDTQCKKCRSEYQTEWYQKNRGRRIAQVAKAVQTWRQKKKAILDEIKSKPCMDCKHSFPPVCMDFDHVRGTKSFTIGSQSSWNVSMDRLMEEVAKCDVVCANCHRIRTHPPIAQR